MFVLFRESFLVLCESFLVSREQLFILHVKINQDVDFLFLLTQVAPCSPPGSNEQFRDSLNSIESAFWCHAAPVGQFPGASSRDMSDQSSMGYRN